MDLILGALARETAAQDTRFLVVYIPARFEVSDRDLEVTRMWYGLDHASWGRAPVLRRLNWIAAAREFPVLDLSGPLRTADHGLLGGPYYQFDGHWNVRGHKVAASAIQEWLAAEGWLPPCAVA